LELRGRWKIGEPKTNKGKRAVLLPEFTIRALRLHQIRMRLEGRKSQWVFVNRKGGILTKANFHAICYKPMLRRAGLRNVTFHDLRHTAITLLFKRGIHPQTIADRSGHARVSTTVNTYSHLVDGMDDVAVPALERVLPIK
jgi:integrase